MPPRCVCGRSERFPICDGSHGDAWTCGTPTTTVGFCVVAGPHLSSLAERLAWEEGGQPLHRLEGAVTASRAVVLSDGTDLAFLAAELERLTAASVLGVAVDAPGAALGKLLAGGPVTSACPDDPRRIWPAVRDALRGESTPAPPLARGFLSHAAADESWLLPAVETLRRHAGAELFVCADSIPAGSAWREHIETSLRSAERLVFVGSAASFASTYCAFEFGLATALQLPRRVLRVDDTPLPPWMGHIQAVDIPRWRRIRPWLSRADAVEEALLDCLAP